MNLKLMDFRNKRFTTWTDEVLWKQAAREAGLTYGVYDNKKNSKHYIEGWIATSYNEAYDKAVELNLKEEQHSMKTPYCMIDGTKYQLYWSERGILRFPNDGRRRVDLNRWVMEYIDGKRPLKDIFENAINSGSSYEYVYGQFSRHGTNNHIVTQGKEKTKKFRLYIGKSAPK